MQISYQKDANLLAKNAAKIINGKALAEKIISQVNIDLQEKGKKPGLAAILVGDDPSSHLYVRLKKEACEKCDINFHSYLFGAKADENEIIKTIEFLNANSEVDAILVQMPLPEKFDTDKIINVIKPEKDIDGFCPSNRAKYASCQTDFYPPLIESVRELILSTHEKIENKNIVILCNSKIFGEPFHCLYGDKNKVEILTTKDLGFQEKTKQADILIVSLGIPLFIDRELVKKDAIIIDIGINQLPGSKDVFGDVNLQDVLEKVKFITPVPGGVGPMTIACLLKNLKKMA